MPRSNDGRGLEAGQRAQKPTSLAFPALWFFLLYASSGTAPPYLALYYRERVKLSTQQIGYLFAVSPFVSFVSSAFWTAVADKSNRHRTILVFLSLCTATTYILLGNVTNFVALMLLTMVNSFFSGPVGAFIDIYTLDVLGPRRAGLYGRLRMVGTIALGGSTFLTGLIVQTVGQGEYSIAFIIYGALQAAFILTVAFSPWRKPVPFTSPQLIKRASQEVIQASKELLTTDRRKYEHSMINLFCSRYMSVFLLTSVLHGMARTMIGTYLFVFLSEYLHAAPMLLGMTAPFGISLEAPMFFFSGFFLTRLGFRKMLYLSLVAILMRAGGYAALTSWAAPKIRSEADGWNYAPAVLVIEMTQGIAYSQFWSAGVHFINSVTPPSLKTSAQGVFSGLSGGLASGLGNIVGGFLLDRFGPGILFQTTLLITVGTFVVFTAIGKLPSIVEKSVVDAVKGEPHTTVVDDEGERILGTGAKLIGSGGSLDQTVTEDSGGLPNVQRSVHLS